MNSKPTPEQDQKMTELRKAGYKWDMKHSIAAAAVIFKRADGDFWLFGVNGEIMHNPEPLLIVKIKAD